MMIVMKSKQFQRGFAMLPVIVIVALVGLMVPTVKYVTDPDTSFNLGSLANTTRPMIDGIQGTTERVTKTISEAQQRAESRRQQAYQQRDEAENKSVINESESEPETISQGTPVNLNDMIDEERGKTDNNLRLVNQAIKVVKITLANHR